MPSVSLIKAMDSLFGSPLCALLPTLKKNKISKVKNILLIQLWGLGETILTLPAVKAIQKHYPNAHLTVLATERNAIVFENQGLTVNKISLNPLSILSYLLRNLRKYSLVVDFEEYLNISSLMAYALGSFRVGYCQRARGALYHQSVPFDDKKHNSKTFEDLAKILGINKFTPLPKLHYSKNDEGKITRLIPKNRVIGIVPGAAESASARMWPKKRFYELCRELKKKYSIVLIGNDKEKSLTNWIEDKLADKKRVVNLAGKLSIEELFALIDRLDLLITNDTGPLHVASAQNTPTIGLFGPNTPVRFGALAKKSKNIYKPKSCSFSPCINVHQGKVPDCLYKKNSINYQKCMKAISVREVHNQVKEILR